MLIAMHLNIRSLNGVRIVCAISLISHKPRPGLASYQFHSETLNGRSSRPEQSNTIAKRSKVNCSINWILTATSSRQARTVRNGQWSGQIKNVKQKKRKGKREQREAEEKKKQQTESWHSPAAAGTLNMNSCWPWQQNEIEMNLQLQIAWSVERFSHV